MSVSDLSSIIAQKGQGCSPETLMAYSETYGSKVSFACIAEKNIAWKFFLPGMTGGGSALVFDSNLGLDSISLSKDFEQVTSVSNVPESIDNIQSRISFHSIENCSTAVVDYDELPFSTDEFDYVFCKDIALIAGLIADSEVNSLLVEMNRVLKDSGYLAIGFNNNSFLRKTNMFGKSLANRRRRSLLGKIETLKEKRKIIKIYPDLYLFSELYESNHTNFFPVKDFVKNIIPYRYSPGVMSCFGPVKDDSLSFVDRLKQALGKKVCIKKAITGNPNLLILFVQVDGEEEIVRIPLCEKSKVRLQNQYEVLTHLLENYPRTNNAIPVQKKPKKISNNIYFQEQRLSGLTVKPTDNTFGDCIKIGYQWIHDLHNLTKKELVLNQTQLDRLFLEPISKIYLLLDDDRFKPTLDAIKLSIVDRFINKKVNIVCFHGDYKIDNIIFDKSKKKLVGIIDWDMSARNGLPCVDLLFFSSYNKRLFNDDLNISEHIINYAIDCSDDYHDINQYLLDLGLSKDDLFYFGLMTWVHHLVVRTTSYMKFSTKWCHENVNVPLELIEKHCSSRLVK